MDRQFVYPGQIPQDVDLLYTNRNVLVALGLLAQDVFGSSTVVGGLPCAATAPATLGVQLGAGRIYSLQSLDATAYGSLPADTTHQIIKQGIQLDPVTLSTPAPSTPGQSIDYLIEATYQDEDGSDAVLEYYNSANPAAPLSGPGGSDSAQPTQRLGRIISVAKAGVSAATGTQAPPAADAGYVGLYVVTVAYGQSSVTASNISTLSGAPFISGALLTETLANSLYVFKAGDTMTGPLTVQGAGSFQSLTVNGTSVNAAAILTSGVLAAARLGTGTANAAAYLAGNSTWQPLAFGAIGGSIAVGQVPQAAVTQYQAALAIAGSQIAGSIAVDGTITAGSHGAAAVAGDISACRDTAPATGVIFLGNGGTYVYFSGSAYVMPTYPVQAGGFQVTSDRRLKRKIARIEGALEKVCELRGVTFEWKATGKASAGVIAQEVERVLPEAVAPLELADPRKNAAQYLTVNEGAVIGLLVEALKEERAARIALEKRLERLERRPR